MMHSDVVELLKKGISPDKNILLDDGEFYIDHNCNYPLERGNGFLQKRCNVSMCTPGGFRCIGGYDQSACDGKWRAFINIVPNEDTDCRPLGEFDDRLEAIAALWMARNEAYC